jgi:hypothetical protein
MKGARPSDYQRQFSKLSPPDISIAQSHEKARWVLSLGPDSIKYSPTYSVGLDNEGLLRVDANCRQLSQSRSQSKRRKNWTTALQYYSTSALEGLNSEPILKVSPARESSQAHHRSHNSLILHAMSFCCKHHSKVDLKREYILWMRSPNWNKDSECDF